eukprot:2878187-Heterocapsa_arctica.AAC.1
MEVTGVLRSIPYSKPVPVQELLQGSLAALEKLQAIVPERDSAEFRLGGCAKDSQRGFAGPM